MARRPRSFSRKTTRRARITLFGLRTWRDELLGILAEADEHERMPGCRLYRVAVDELDLDGVWVTEVWDSEAAHAASLELEWVKQQIARAMPMLDPGGFERQQLDARAGIPT